MCAQARLRTRASARSGRIAAVNGKPIALSAAQAQVVQAAGELAGAGPGREGAVETLALEQALGRTLAEDVAAAHALPPFDASAMDGYALRAADLSAAGSSAPVALSLCGEARAGHPFAGTVQAGQAVVISTGAMLPGGADAVVRLEDARREDRRVLFDRPVAPGSDVRRAGADVAAGELALARGRRLAPVELALLAALGHAHVRVARAPGVRLLATGDELTSPGKRLGAGGIFESNSHALAALAQLAGAKLLGREAARDERELLAGALQRTLAADVAVICGGVSVGPHDHVAAALGQLGAQKRFHGVALQPGKPIWFGLYRSRTLVFGLPGNPVSALVGFVLFVGPALRRLLGASPFPRRLQAVLAEDYPKRPGRTLALRCTLRQEGERLIAAPTGAQGSHLLSSLLNAQGLAMLPAERGAISAGELVEVEPLAPWLGWRW